MAPLIVALVVAAFTIMMVASAVRVVRQSHVGTIERFGKYRRTLPPGLHIVVPLLDRMPVVVDMRETVQPFAPQPVITQDNVTIANDTVVYFQVTDAFRATYEVANFLLAMEQLAQTTLRNLVGAMTLEETLTSRDQINSQLRTVLDEATEKWGVRVTRVELKSIDPPRSIQEAMEQQMRADRAKRAANSSLMTGPSVSESPGACMFASAPDSITSALAASLPLCTYTGRPCRCAACTSDFSVALLNCGACGLPQVS
jgi:regulator of protease activity HflC (stomatin/prohibitin superfamily)